MDETTIQLRFQMAIKDATSRLGVTLGQGNELYLPQMASDAAKRIVDTVPDGPEREAIVAKGQIAFASLILEMVRAAETIPGYPAGMIGEQSRELALYARGPFPPFW